MDRNRLLTIGAVLAAIVVLAVGFVAGVSPQLRAASEATAQNAQVTAQNAQLEAGIASLKSKFSKLDSLTSQLDGLQDAVPANASAPTFINQLNDMAKSSHVEISSLTMGDAAAYVAPAASSTSTTAVAGTAPVAPSALTNSEITGANFSVIPVTLTVTGTYGQALDFLSAIHSGKRLFLVTTFAGGAQSSADGTAGSWNIAGSIYALTDASTANAEKAATTSGTTASAGDSGSSSDTAAGK